MCVYLNKKQHKPLIINIIQIRTLNNPKIMFLTIRTINNIFVSNGQFTMVNGQYANMSLHCPL